jgi:hypothetical protein
MYIDDDRVLRHYDMPLWDLFDPNADRSAWPKYLTNTYISMHEGEPPACSLIGVHDYQDYSFNKLSHVQAELYRIITMYLTRRLVLTHDSRDTKCTSADQSPVPGIESLLYGIARHGKHAVVKSTVVTKTAVVTNKAAGATKTSGDSGGAAARSHADGGPVHKKQKIEVAKSVKAPKIAFGALLERYTMDDVIEFFREECAFSHFILVFIVPAEWGNLTSKNAAVRMGFAAPFVEKRHREHMKRYFDLTAVPSPNEILQLISSSPFLKGKMCVHTSSTLIATSRTLIAQMRDTDVLFFNNTTSTNDTDVLSFTITSSMYVTQETRSLQSTPFGSILDDEPIYTSLCNAVNTVKLGDRELVMYKAKMTVYGVNCDEGSI